MERSFRDFLTTTTFDEFTDIVEGISNSEEITKDYRDEFHSTPVIQELRARVILLNEHYKVVKDAGNLGEAEQMLRTRDAGVVLYATLLAVWREIHGELTETLTEDKIVN
jgi:hypothetical protein